MKERHWNDLVMSVRQGLCVLVLGPEIPAQPAAAAGAEPEALSYAEALTRQLKTELEAEEHRVSGRTLAAVAQQYEDDEDFGAKAMRTAAAQFYTSGKLAFSDVHRALAMLPVKLIMSTAHDDLMEQALKALDKRPQVYRYHLRGDRQDNPEYPQSDSFEEPVLYHLFGSAGEPRSLVLSENDVLDFIIAVSSARPPLPSSLTSMLKRTDQSFLFVGFGIKQLHLRVLLKLLVRTLELNRSTSSAIATEPLRALPDGEREQTILFYQRGTRVEVEDSEITAFLTELGRRVEAAGGYVTQAPVAGPRARVFISYAREDGDLAARVCQILQKANFHPWFDKESLQGGALWDQNIRAELEDTDFVLVLYTPALLHKTDGYVNREIMLAADRALAVRGSFLIPLRTVEIAPDDRIEALAKFNDMEVRPGELEEDMAKVISTMRREYQRRNR